MNPEEFLLFINDLISWDCLFFFMCSNAIENIVLEFMKHILWILLLFLSSIDSKRLNFGFSDKKILISVSFF